MIGNVSKGDRIITLKKEVEIPNLGARDVLTNILETCTLKSENMQYEKPHLHQRKFIINIEW